MNTFATSWAQAQAIFFPGSPGATFTLVTSGSWYGLEFAEGSTTYLIQDDSFTAGTATPTLDAVIRSFGGNQYGLQLDWSRWQTSTTSAFAYVQGTANGIPGAITSLFGKCVDYATRTGGNAILVSNIFMEVQATATLYFANAYAGNPAYTRSFLFVAGTTSNQNYAAGVAYQPYSFEPSSISGSQPATITINNRRFTSVDQFEDVAGTGQTTGLDLDGVICDADNPSTIEVDSGKGRRLGERSGCRHRQSGRPVCFFAVRASSNLER